jgi:hypothetical protein
MRMPIRRVFVCSVTALAAAFAVQAPALAQSKADATVTVNIRRHPTVSLQVVPRGVGVCKRAGTDCLNEVTWQPGPGANGLEKGEYLIISYKTSPGNAPVCFPHTDYRLAAATPDITSGPVQEACNTPAVWFYTVTLMSDAGTPNEPADDVRLAEPLDPGVIIDSHGSQ